jgi:hypothetical protein
MIPIGRSANRGTYRALDTLFSVFAPKDAQRIISFKQGEHPEHVPADYTRSPDGDRASPANRHRRLLEVIGQ